ncbi:polyubiquitin-A-like [Lampetra planeri]
MDCSETIGDRNGPCTLQRGESPKNDRRYIMYHGTDAQGARGILAQGFRRSERGMLGPGVYVSRDIEKARRYPIRKPENVKVILKLRVNVGRVKKIDGQDHPLRLTWHDEGYDTAWVPRGCGMVTSELEEDCVWDPERITVVGVEEAPSSEMKTIGESPKNDRRYIMYHGTDAQGARGILAQGFRRSERGMLGPGVYVSRDIEKARRYPIRKPENVKVILKLRVNVGRVKKIDGQDHPLRLTWHDEGYDTAWVPRGCGMVTSELEEDCVWDPERITVVGVEEAPSSEMKTMLLAMMKNPNDAVQIVVKDLEGKSLRLMVKLSESVLALKVRIQSKWKVSPAQQRLAYGGTALQDATTLANCGLKQNATVNLLHVDHAVDVFVKTLANKTLTIEVKLSDSVLSLKQKVQQKAGIPVDQQMLTFGSHTLENNQKLEWYGIQQHSTITMQGRLRGGGRRVRDFKRRAARNGRDTRILSSSFVSFSFSCETSQVEQRNPCRGQRATAGTHASSPPPSSPSPSLARRVKWNSTAYRSSRLHRSTTMDCSETIGDRNGPCTLQRGESPKNDRRYIMYHGTDAQGARGILAQGFRRSERGMLGPGVYVSRDIEKARRYPIRKPENVKVILKLRVNVGRVKKIDGQDHPLRLTWHDEGYDTAWVPRGCGMVTSELEEDCVWDPERITVVGVEEAPSSEMKTMLLAMMKNPNDAVQIVVKDLEGKSLRLMVKLSESVLALKVRIQSKWKVSPAQQRLAYGGTALQDATTLANCGLKQNATVNLLHVDHAVDVFVKTLANKTLTIEVKLSDSVLSLKQKVQQKAGIPVDQQMLTFGSHTLENNQKLEWYGIQQHSTITMQGRLRGGARSKGPHSRACRGRPPHATERSCGQRRHRGAGALIAASALPERALVVFRKCACSGDDAAGFGKPPKAKSLLAPPLSSSPPPTSSTTVTTNSSSGTFRKPEREGWRLGGAHTAVRIGLSRRGSAWIPQPRGSALGGGGACATLKGGQRATAGTHASSPPSSSPSPSLARRVKWNSTAYRSSRLHRSTTMDCSETIGDRNGPCSLQGGESPKNDRRYIMYHGTDAQGARGILAQGFRRSERGMLGPGVYVSRDIEKARRYPIRKPENVKVILKLRVNVGRVKKIDGQDHPLRLTWHDEGYDTAWVPRGCGMVTSELEEDCVWDPERITVVGVEEAPSSEMKTMLFAMMKNPNDVVQIVVKDLEGKSLRLMVKLSESVLALKVRIQSKWKVSPAQQRLAYGGTALQDATTLAKCGLKQNATVNLLHVDHAVDVFVKTLANKTLTIEVKLSDSVLSLKQKVQQKAGIAVNQQMLTFGSHTLDDNQKLEWYGIQQHSTITMQGRLRGG